MNELRVLVAGGSGFIAGHCIVQLLEQGHLVRATVRSLQREGDVRAVLSDAGAVRGDALTFGEGARRVPTRTIPDVVVRLAALFSAEFRTVAAELGHVKQVSNDKARRVLGLRPRTCEEAVLAAAESMIAKSLVRG